MRDARPLSRAYDGHDVRDLLPVPHCLLARHVDVGEHVVDRLLLVDRVDEVGSTDVAAVVAVASAELNDDRRAGIVGERTAGRLGGRLQVKLLVQRTTLNDRTVAAVKILGFQLKEKRSQQEKDRKENASELQPQVSPALLPRRQMIKFSLSLLVLTVCTPSFAGSLMASSVSSARSDCATFSSLSMMSSMRGSRNFLSTLVA